jgi:hypothetical protein
VPWDDLVGEPNIGHAAVADLLICRAAHAAMSANFDPLIEQWSEGRKVAMQGALTGAEAVEFAARTNPLLKFHGCLRRGRDDTLWTRVQLQEPEVQQRVQNCSAWMTAHLPAKDLLIVGFWTDWGYLNNVLANAIAPQAGMTASRTSGTRRHGVHHQRSCGFGSRASNLTRWGKQMPTFDDAVYA